MRLDRIKLLVLVPLLMWAIALPSKAESAKTLTIAADVWCPINCAPSASEQGIGVELARKIFEPLGYKINYIVMPWSRALGEVRAGPINAAVGANKQDDPKLLFPKQPICPMTDNFYVKASSHLQFKNVESLKGLAVGVIMDYGYSKQVQAFIEQHKNDPRAIQFVGGDDALEQNIRKLLAGHVDVVIESKTVMDYTLKHLGLTDQVKSIGSTPQGNVYLAFSPALAESKKHLQEYDAGFARLKAAGEIKNLYQRYEIPVVK